MRDRIHDLEVGEFDANRIPLGLEPIQKMVKERGLWAARIYDGPDEVHRIVVARQVLKSYAAPADGVPTEHIPTRRATLALKVALALK